MLRTCFICSRKSSSVNCSLRILRSSSCGLALVHLALGLLDEGHDVAHAEDPLGHPVGVEALEVAELLAGRGVEDRLAGDRLDRERRAAAGVAVELREDHAVEVGRLGELLGHVHRVLAGHRVDHEQHVVRLRALLDLGRAPSSAPRRRGAGRSCRRSARRGGPASPGRAPTRRCPPGRGPCPARTRARPAWAPTLISWSTAAGPVHVAGGHGHVHPVLLAQVPRELAGGGRLARALEARHQDHGRPGLGEGEVAPDAAHQRGELVGDDLHDLLARVQRRRARPRRARAPSPPAVNSLTTLKFTSASSRARRTWRIALLTSSSVSLPRERTSPRAA